MLDVIDDFLWTLRREGMAISPAQAIDVVRALREVGFSNFNVTRDALACVLVDSPQKAALYSTAFTRFFSVTREPARDLDQRLRERGFADHEIAALRELLHNLLPQHGARTRGVLLGGEAWLDHLLATDAVLRWLGKVTSSAQAGFYAHRIFDEVGLGDARSAVSSVCQALTDALGSERGAALAQALVDEIVVREQRVRETVEQRALALQEAESGRRDARATPFMELSDRQSAEVVAAVRALAAKLAGAVRVHRRHARHGRVDPGRTMRQSFRTGGVPFRAVRVDRRRDKPRIVLLCDVSDSVRGAVRFMLEFVYAMRELFDTTRCFVFVNDVVEVSALFDRESINVALARATAFGARGISSYGRALLQFERAHRDAVDRRTSLLVLGDGRTNYLAGGEAALGRLRERAQDVLWLCTEPRSRWGHGDSAMLRYAEQVTQVFEAANAEGLERAARALIRRAR